MMDLNNKIVSLPISAGINSAAVLCWLIESGMMPKELHLFYAHFKEHSPDSMAFSVALMEMAKKHFPCVKTMITDNSVLAFFEQKKMIPHPMISPCSKNLKIEPMMLYNATNLVDVDLIGYIRTEKKRMDNNGGKNDLFLSTEFPISQFDDEWCFTIVKKHLGWYPAIYDILDDKGKKVFKHNNCLPCKNMQINQMKAVEKYYPEYMEEAKKTSDKLKAYWGRNADAYYTEFGKQDYEPSACDVCTLD